MSTIGSKQTHLQWCNSTLVKTTLELLLCGNVGPRSKCNIINVTNVDKEEQRAKYWGLWHARCDWEGCRCLFVNYHLLFSDSVIVHDPLK